jgi:diguanylate cyclase (GGDEF)-like protein/PAS domain S-box-containing protein
MRTEISHASPTVLTLDLRVGQGVEWPKINYPSASRLPDDGGFSAFTICTLLVAIDGDAAYSAWQERFRPKYFSRVRYVILLDPYTPDLARRALRDGAADCCAMTDAERLSLILTRLEGQTAGGENHEETIDDLTTSFWLRTILDALPSPVFVKNREYRYTICNKAFEEYAGRRRDEIIGATVYELWPADLAKVYDKADRDLMLLGGTQIYETNIRYADGTYHDVVMCKSVFLDSQGSTNGIAGTMLDITERKRMEGLLAEAASTDYLTGIYNLRAFHDLANHAFHSVTRHTEDVALITIDLDYFKAINDQHGHEAGNAALGLLVQAVKSNLREQDIFARTGGDEFCILLPSASGIAALAIAERIRVAVNRLSVESANGTTMLSISTGVTLFQSDDRQLQDAIRRADEALYEAKAAGRNRVLLLLPSGQKSVDSCEVDEDTQHNEDS